MELSPKRERTVVQVSAFLALVLAASGAAKLAGVQAAVDLFTAFQLPGWTLWVVGSLETATAVLLIIPKTRGFGALGVCAIMAGATLAHVLTGVMRPMLVLNLGLFATGLWLTLHHRPAFLALDWAADPHRHEPTHHP